MLSDLMFMPRLITFFAACIITITALAEGPAMDDNTAIQVHQSCISGVVKDQISGENLIGVKVTLLETNQSLYTDIFGEFMFEHLKSGTYNLQLEYISYHQKEIHNVPLNIPGLGELSIELEPSRVEISSLVN